MTNTAARTVSMMASGTAGQTTVIKDSACTASSAPITISVASSGTIDGVANQVINSDCGSLTINWISSGVYETKSPIGNIYGGTVTLTTATTDVATVPGARSTSLCWAMPTNATAATAVVYDTGRVAVIAWGQRRHRKPCRHYGERWHNERTLSIIQCRASKTEVGYWLRWDERTLRTW